MNLLIDPLLRIETPQGMTALNLPALLEALGQDQVDSLPGLQRHQVDPFHVFLCYLAGAVLARQGQTEPVQPEAFWRDGIRTLTGQPDDAAWTLVVDDVTRPAFMQAPLENPIALKQAFKRQIMIPDELDLLPTAKNHDIKLSRMADSTL